MSKLWVFGDSFSAGFEQEGQKNTDWNYLYTKWKGYVPKVYGEIISDRLDIELENKSKSANDNYSIFQSFCDNVKNIENEDVVIIGWTDYVRFRLVNNNYWERILPTFVGKIKFISRQTIDEILVNRTSKIYVSELNSWIGLINMTLKNNIVIHWTPFGYSFNGMSIHLLDKIRNETNGEVDDMHFSEKGQLDLSEIFLDKILKNNNLI